MKKYLAVLLSASLLMLAPHKAYGMTNMIDATDVTKTSWTATGTTKWYPIAQTCGVYIRVRSASTSTATIKIEGYTDDSTHVEDLTRNATPDIVDPTDAGERWFIPPTGYVRVNVSAISAGTITATIEGSTCAGLQIY